jgi:hypothetical protein
MRIDSAGNVGINTTAASWAKLDVNGQVFLRGGAAMPTGQSLRFNNYYNAGTFTDKTINDGNAAAIYFDTDGGFFSFRSSTSSVTAGGDISVTERMRITSGGNLLIGTTTDNGQKLQVIGAINCLGADAGLFTADRAFGNIFGFYGSTNFFLYNGAVGNIGTFDGTTGSYTPVSDVNKKKDFEHSTIGLEAVLALKPTLYRMKDDDETKQKQLGFIAQEVKDFIPQAYVENGDDEFKFIGLQDRPIIAALVKAVQELNDKVETLQSELETLKS